MKILGSQVRFKNKRGGVTRKVEEDFVKRTVQFAYEDEEREIEIEKKDLSLSATEEQMVAYIEKNIDKSKVRKPSKETEKLKEKLEEAQDMIIALLSESEKEKENEQ